MANRNAQAIAIHPRHEARKLRPMVRTSAEHIELPLVNHFMRQRPCDFLFDLISKQWQRESNKSPRLI